MGSRYDQLTLEERCAIAELYRAGRSIRQIAAAVDREPSTISRELKRNTGSGPSSGAYQAGYAQQQTEARRWSGTRLDRDPALRDRVLGLLAQGCRPAGGWPAQARRGPNRHRLRDHLPLHLRPAETHQRRRLATLSPQSQGQARPPAQEGRQPGLADQGPCLRPPAPVGGARSTPSRPLGSRLHALRPLRPVSSGPARANLQAHRPCPNRLSRPSQPPSSSLRSSSRCPNASGAP